MAAITNTTMTADIQVTAREVDFVTRFSNNFEALREILGIMRPIKKAPNTVLKSKYAEITLQSGDVGEGEEIPFSKATVKEKDYATLKLEKYGKAVTAEAIIDHGYEAAVEMTDAALLNELQGNVTDRFYTFLGTGKLTSTETSWQMAIAMAIGRVKDKFKKMRKTSTNIILFVNTLDAYKYLGAANITVQTAFGLDYIQNFMGAGTVIISSEIPEGKVYATPSENIVLYYIDPSESDLQRAGINFTVVGETNLIGAHVEGNHRRVQSEIEVLMGFTMFAEYLDAIAVITVQDHAG